MNIFELIFLNYRKVKELKKEMRILILFQEQKMELIKMREDLAIQQNESLAKGCEWMKTVLTVMASGSALPNAKETKLNKLRQKTVIEQGDMYLNYYNERTVVKKHRVEGKSATLFAITCVAQMGEIFVWF